MQAVKRIISGLRAQRGDSDVLEAVYVERSEWDACRKELREAAVIDPGEVASFTLLGIPVLPYDIEKPSAEWWGWDTV